MFKSTPKSSLYYNYNYSNKGQFEGSWTLNFKVIRQGYVIYFNNFEFSDLVNIKKNTNLMALSQLI